MNNAPFWYDSFKDRASQDAAVLELTSNAEHYIPLLTSGKSWPQLAHERRLPLAFPSNK